MIRLIFIFLLVLSLVVGGIWVETNVSTITFGIQDNVVRVTPILFITFILAFYLVLALVVKLILTLINFPRLIYSLFRGKRIENAEPLNNLILAIKNYDIRAAEQSYKKAVANAMDDVIADLMQAKIYEIKGATKDAIRIYNKYTTDDRISNYGLFKSAKLNLNLGNIETAFISFKQLAGLSGSKEILRYFLITGLKLGRYNEVIDVLDSKSAIQAFGKARINRVLSYVYSQQAVSFYQQGIYNDALELSQIANKIAPDLISAEMEILSAIKLGEFKFAHKQLVTHFKFIDDMRLYSFISILAKHEAPEKLYHYYRGLLDLSSSRSLVMVAKSALEAGDYKEASVLITKALDDKIPIANLLMAEYCLKTHGNASEAFMWFERFSSNMDYITEIEFENVKHEVYNLLYTKEQA